MSQLEAVTIDDEECYESIGLREREFQKSKGSWELRCSPRTSTGPVLPSPRTRPTLVLGLDLVGPRSRPTLVLVFFLRKTRTSPGLVLRLFIFWKFQRNFLDFRRISRIFREIS